MADSEKKTMSTLAAQAVARVKGQSTFTGAWGAEEHIALFRYMAVDAATSLVKTPVFKGKGQDGKAVTLKVVFAPTAAKGEITLPDALNATLRAAFSQDPELAYASSFQKLLAKMGEITSLHQLGLVVVLWPLLVKEIAKQVRESRPEYIRELGRRSRAEEVSKEWLRNRITVAEAEAKLGGGWREMVASTQAGDELWEYCSSEHSWEHLAGRAGIALVRKGEVVDAITTVMN
jgi:hypothetical protein